MINDQMRHHLLALAARGGPSGLDIHDVCELSGLSEDVATAHLRDLVADGVLLTSDGPDGVRYLPTPAAQQALATVVSSLT